MNENERIEKLRQKLYKFINEFGTLAPETQMISKRLDKMIDDQFKNEVEYPYGAELKECYYESYRHLKNLTREYGEFPKTKEWNKYAYENNLLCHISIEYISNRSWNELRDYIVLEII